MCKSAPCSRQITTPVPHCSVFLQTGCPSCHPTNSVKTLKVNIYPDTCGDIQAVSGTGWVNVRQSKISFCYCWGHVFVIHCPCIEPFNPVHNGAIAMFWSMTLLMDRTSGWLLLLSMIVLILLLLPGAPTGFFSRGVIGGGRGQWLWAT